MESKTEWNLRECDFWNERDPGDLEYKPGKFRGSHEIGGPPTPPGRALHPRGPLVAPLTYFFLLYIPIYPKTIEEQNRSEVPLPKASIAMKNQLGARFGTLPEGETITSGHLHHPGGLHDEEGVVYPRGWGYVPVAMCLISLARVLEVVRSWCIANFAIIVGSYDVSPPLLSCNGLSFPFEVILSDWVFKDLRTLDVCLACAYLWWQWDIHVIHLMYVLVINLRVPPIYLCIGVGTLFRLDSPVETLGHSLKFFVLVWIDEYNIVWCISYNQTHGYLWWHWSI